MQQIDYFYSAHSAFAYLGARKLYQVCADQNVRLVHKPINLSPVVEAQGALPFRDRTQAHVDYFFGREIERWAEYRGVDVVPFRPTYHDADYGLANGMIAALGADGADVDALSLAILQAHWRDDADLSNPQILGQIAQYCGHDPMRLIAQAASNEVRDVLEANARAAIAQAAFGSPTYVLNGDPFYGQDRLELVEHAVHRPFSPTAWKNPPVH